MKTPVALFTGTNDWLADPTDVDDYLKPNLKNVVFTKNIDAWNHMDFIWGKNTHTLIYNDMLKLMEKS